jgi:IS30 family transposase
MADRMAREGYAGSKRLTSEQVLKIKKLLGEGKLSRRKIADLYGVNHTTIGNIARGKTWGYL